MQMQYTVKDSVSDSVKVYHRLALLVMCTDISGVPNFSPGLKIGHIQNSLFLLSMARRAEVQ